ncbi:PD-(D/E)XK motif protein [Micromonospora sp. NPDC048843]|uniref:PD-(D/E)XK motif protein n=1 Tax=Micromonospora sp. NPDC048843 TaxID=3155389 RepID=UPI0033F29AAF
MIEIQSFNKRHVSTESFERYLESGVPIVLPIGGIPKIHIFIEPLRSELGLRIEAGPELQVPDTGLRNIIARIAVHDGKRFLEVVVTVASLFRDAYPVLCLMADRIQLSGFSASGALRATLDKMSSLLRTPDSMSREREVGLFGELLILGGLISSRGLSNAVQAWRGGQREEHDFGLPTLDVEVKTTTAERRAHWVGSLTQMVPTPERPLWLISHQVTAAGAGHGRTLPDLVDNIRLALGTGAARDSFEATLSGSGWHEEDRERLGTHWTRRAESRAFVVAGAFPRLTPDALRHADVAWDRMPEVRYRIVLDGLESEEDVPEVISTAMGFEGRI